MKYIKKGRRITEGYCLVCNEVCHFRCTEVNITCPEATINCSEVNVVDNSNDPETNTVFDISCRIQQLIREQLREHFRCISAVSGSGKIKNHGKLPPFLFSGGLRADHPVK